LILAPAGWLWRWRWCQTPSTRFSIDWWID
jgi:hypothetical protein